MIRIRAGIVGALAGLARTDETALPTARNWAQLMEWLSQEMQLSALKFLEVAHGLVLKGLLILAVLVGLFPVVVVCDGGKILGCIVSGAAFAGIVAGASLATVGLAIAALRNPGRRSRIYLFAYSVLLIAFRFYALPSAPNFSLLLDAGATLGVLTMLSVIFFGTGRLRVITSGGP